VNGGQKICLRLRPARDPHSFIDEEQVVLVMLHELTHNVHGPHNEQFYKFLNTLELEWEELKRSGYSGDGFHSVGKRVGAGISHDVPVHKVRAKAIEAAERRAEQQRLLGGPGRRLGTSGERLKEVINKTPRELAAAAAERRARDEKACASGAQADSEAQNAADESIVTVAMGTPRARDGKDYVIDLTLDEDDWPTSMITGTNLPSTSRISVAKCSYRYHRRRTG